MILIINKSNSRYGKSKVNGNPHYLAHENEPIDFYRKYKDNDYLPMKGERNIKNLFDESDVKDYYWLNIARKYLNKISM
jgi:hypothetical protein